MLQLPKINGQTGCERNNNNKTQNKTHLLLLWPLIFLGSECGYIKLTGGVSYKIEYMQLRAPVLPPSSFSTKMKSWKSEMVLSYIKEKHHIPINY